MQIYVCCITDRDLTWSLILKVAALTFACSISPYLWGDSSQLLCGPLKLCNVKQEWTCKSIEAICIQKVPSEKFCLINVKQMHFEITSLKTVPLENISRLNYIHSNHCSFLQRCDAFLWAGFLQKVPLTERFNLLLTWRQKRSGNQGPCWD